ncbi:30S ribosomal protein S17 [Candidatus Uhrbacteria bacterium]|nr:30S ribosomal protein S17 [Candidatus Uhrbacteria bacterium]
MTQATPIIRRLQGIVVSDKMDKTIVVRVDRTRLHAKYKKRYTVSRKYYVHDPFNTFHTGDTVEFVASRPLSRTKRWRVVYPKGTTRQQSETVVDTSTQS